MQRHPWTGDVHHMLVLGKCACPMEGCLAALWYQGLMVQHMDAQDLDQYRQVDDPRPLGLVWPKPKKQDHFAVRISRG